ncbi:nicotinamide mononucleotide transporter [Candidatus Saccharibacteria bacterium]|nr:nicotinamide mononucleotide transporter [Candidatus Saccharibacteria bacterium]
MKTSHKTKNTKTKASKLTPKNIAVIVVCIIVPAIIGICSGDLIIGGTLLATGLLSSYCASLQKRYNYIFAFVNALLIAYVGFKNNLFGSFAINAFIFAPLEAFGFFAWSQNLDKKKKVKIRKLTTKNAILVVCICLVGSIIFGYLLTKIPTQQMAFLDSTISCIDICALVMMNLRFRESWWLWVISGVLAIIMWSVALLEGGDNALMRLIAAIGFLIINAYGATKWHRELKS